MKFKTDENLSVSVAEFLRERGHDAMSVLDQHLGGEPDCRIAEVVKAEERALVTLDLDFANIQAYPPTDYCGILVLRTLKQDIGTIRRLLDAVLPLLEREEISGKLWIVEEGRVRIR